MSRISDENEQPFARTKPNKVLAPSGIAPPVIQPVTHSPTARQASVDASELFSVLARPDSRNDSVQIFGFNEHGFDFARKIGAQASAHRNALNDVTCSAANLQDSLQVVRRNLGSIQNGLLGAQVLFPLLPTLQELDARRTELNVQAEKLPTLYQQWLPIAIGCMAALTFVDE